MAKFRTVAGGFRQEIVEDYQATGAGVVVPTAFDDNFGGRPGLTGATMLAPPVDDPPMDGEAAASLPPSRLINPPVATLAQPPRKATAEKPAAPPVVTSPSGPPPDPHVMQESAMATSPQHTQQERPSVDPAADQMTDRLASLVAHPAVAAILRGDALSQQAEAPAAAVETDTLAPPPLREFVQVTLEGEFGRFRTKASDVIICENHVALLYTRHAGDEDLAYEPPMGRTFLIHVPKTDGDFHRLHVQHFGLITRLEMLGAVIVVLPYSRSEPEAATSEEG